MSLGEDEEPEAISIDRYAIRAIESEEEEQHSVMMDLKVDTSVITDEIVNHKNQQWS
jgi:hypothetical protein